MAPLGVLVMLGIVLYGAVYHRKIVDIVGIVLYGFVTLSIVVAFALYGPTGRISVVQLGNAVFVGLLLLCVPGMAFSYHFWHLRRLLAEEARARDEQETAPHLSPTHPVERSTGFPASEVLVAEPVHSSQPMPDLLHDTEVLAGWEDRRLGEGSELRPATSKVRRAARKGQRP